MNLIMDVRQFYLREYPFATSQSITYMHAMPRDVTQYYQHLMMIVYFEMIFGLNYSSQCDCSAHNSLLLQNTRQQGETFSVSLEHFHQQCHPFRYAATSDADVAPCIHLPFNLASQQIERDQMLQQMQILQTQTGARELMCTSGLVNL